MAHSKIRTGVYICHCDTNISSKIDVPEVVTYTQSLEVVHLACDYAYTCSKPGQELIKEDIRTFNLNRIVVASCSPLMHKATFHQACSEGGLHPNLMAKANIREQCSWVVDNPDQATRKAYSSIAVAIFRVRNHLQLSRKVMVTPAALIVGGGIAGIEPALRLADSGKEVNLVEKESSIGGHLFQIYKTFPALDCAA